MMHILIIYRRSQAGIDDALYNQSIYACIYDALFNQRRSQAGIDDVPTSV